MSGKRFATTECGFFPLTIADLHSELILPVRAGASRGPGLGFRAGGVKGYCQQRGRRVCNMPQVGSLMRVHNVSAARKVFFFCQHPTRRSEQAF